MQNMYFSSPEESVEIISRLLLDEDWTRLSAYYHIPDENPEFIDSLRSGDYFIRKERPGTAHPGGFWKYKHPFPPGFRYASHESLDGDRIMVTVTTEIDQGDGMVQRGQDTFLLIKIGQGYKVLPEGSGD